MRQALPETERLPDDGWSKTEKCDGGAFHAQRTTMLRNGVMPMPPARRTAARAELLCSTRLPNGPSIFTWLPTGSFSNTRLKAEPRIRVAIRRVSSCGALASENVWVFPVASVAGGSINVKSTVWPELKVHPGGFSKRKARVRSATSSCPSNLIIKAGDISGLTGDFSLNLKMFVRRLVRSARHARNCQLPEPAVVPRVPRR